MAMPLPLGIGSRVSVVLVRGALLAALLVACSSEPATTATPGVDSGTTATETEAGAPDDAGADVQVVADAGSDAGTNRGVCASKFGNALTSGFGRIDGTVTAVQIPADTHCALPNDDHVIVQVQMGGAIYRLVVNVQSDRAGQDPRVRFGAVETPLPAPAWSEGWHTGLSLDYAATLGAHDTAGFTPMVMNDLVAKIASEITVGAPISIYAQSGNGRTDSAHLIHRNSASRDGAIVVNPTAEKARFLLFHFDGQKF